jgi:hypothetical protein
VGIVQVQWRDSRCNHSRMKRGTISRQLCQLFLDGIDRIRLITTRQNKTVCAFEPADVFA